MDQYKDVKYFKASHVALQKPVNSHKRLNVVLIDLVDSYKESHALNTM